MSYLRAEYTKSNPTAGHTPPNIQATGSRFDQPAHSAGNGSDHDDGQDPGARSISRFDGLGLRRIRVAAGRDLVFLGVGIVVDGFRLLRLGNHQVRRDAAQGRHLHLQSLHAVPRRLSPGHAAQVVRLARALLADCFGRAMQFGEDFLTGRRHQDGGKRHPHREIAFEAKLIAIAGHDGLAGDLRHDVAAKFLREKLVHGRVQQAVDSLQPLVITIGLAACQLAIAGRKRKKRCWWWGVFT